jgi:hypothetical protein
MQTLVRSQDVKVAAGVTGPIVLSMEGMVAIAVRMDLQEARIRTVLRCPETLGIAAVQSQRIRVTAAPDRRSAVVLMTSLRASWQVQRNSPSRSSTGV